MVWCEEPSRILGCVSRAINAFLLTALWFCSLYVLLKQEDTRTITQYCDAFLQWKHCNIGLSNRGLVGFIKSYTVVRPITSDFRLDTLHIRHVTRISISQQLIQYKVHSGNTDITTTLH